MAFKMKNPGMGKLAKSAGSPHKFGIAGEMKGIDSASRGTKGIGPDGEPMKMKKDFGMEGSAMKFKGIRDKIAERKAKKLYKTQDPDSERGPSGTRKGRQDIAETGAVDASRNRKKGRKLKELQVDTEGNVKSMKKEKVRGRDVEKVDGTVKKKGRIVTKEFDAEGNKVKKVYKLDDKGEKGELVKEKTSKTRKLGKKNIGKAAEKKVASERRKEKESLKRSNKPIREANERTKAENEAIRKSNEGKKAAEEKKYNAWRDKQIADGATDVPTFEEAHKSRMASEAKAPTTMKRKSAMKMKRKSALKDKDNEGGDVSATATIPGTKSDKIVPAKTEKEKADYAEYLKNETPEQKERRLARESGKPAETRKYKSEYTYGKEKELQKEKEAKRKEGKYNTLRGGKKKKKRFIQTKVGRKLYDAKKDVKRALGDLTLRRQKDGLIGKKKKGKAPKQKTKPTPKTECKI